VAPGDVDALGEALRYGDFDAFKPGRAIAHARQFAPELFRARLQAEVTRLTGIAL
jgi:hypothetical protein